MSSQNSDLPEGFKITALGPLPQEWETARLGELFEIKQGKALSPEHRRGISPGLFLRTANVLWGHLNLANVDNMDFTDNEVSQLRLMPNDLLVCEGGDIGRTAIWRGQLDVCCYQNHLHRLRAIRDDVYPLYYMYWMQAAHLLLGLYEGTGNKTTIPNLSQSRLKSFILPVPPLPKQKAIAEVLSTIQKAVEAQDKIIAAARELKKSLMRHLFSYGPVPVSEAEKVLLKETEIGPAPEHWNVVGLGEVVDMKYGYRTVIPKNPPQNGVKIISTADILKDGQLDLTGIRTVEIPEQLVERYTVAKNDLLFNWRNAQEHVGKTALLEFDLIEPTVFASFIIRIRTKEQIHYRYLHFLLAYYRLEGVFFKLSRRAVNQANYNANELAQLNVLIPPISEQEKIAGILLKADEKIMSGENRKASLQALFKTMLHQLMTGKVRVNNLEAPVL